MLGVVPLAFSTSEIIRTIFVVFIGLVTLGLGHGLILLPVLLSLIGPTNILPDEEVEKLPHNLFSSSELYIREHQQKKETAEPTDTENAVESPFVN